MDSTDFDDVRLPEDVETGAQSGPSFRTSIISLSGGGEQRNSEWAQERLMADISYGIMAKEDPDDIENSYLRVLDFFRARRGRHRSFRFRDYADFQAVGETAYPYADNKVFQLCKTYGTYIRRITRPVLSTLYVYVDGAPIASGWTYGALGTIVFAEAQTGAVTADFEFDVPVRFDTDIAQAVISWMNAGSITPLKIVQVLE